MGFVMLRFLFEIWCLLFHNVHCFLSRWPRDAQNLFHLPLFEPNDSYLRREIKSYFIARLLQHLCNLPATFDIFFCKRYQSVTFNNFTI